MTSEQMQLLLIDDDEIDRELVRRLIGKSYTLIEAKNGEEGMALYKAKFPDIILLDYRLPDINSFTILDYMTAHDVPVIVLTGEEQPDIIVEAMQKGAHDYLLKSHISQVRLEQAVENALEKAALRRNVIAQQHQIAEQTQVLREQNRQIRTLASAVTLAEQRERKRIAQVLHDHVQQLLYGVQMRMHLLIEDIPSSATELLRDNLSEASSLIHDAIDAARSLSVDLSPPVLKDEGINIALEWLAAHMKRIHDLQVDLQVEPDFDYHVESEELYVLIFQLVRELLFNVVKHANVKSARLHLFIEEGNHKILVEDKGVGFEGAQVVQPYWNPKQGYGLYSIRERLTLFDGSLDIDSTIGNGARITINLPSDFANTSA